MKRLILDFYRNHLPDGVKNAVPPVLKVGMLGGLYGLTRYPDLRMWQMKLLHDRARGFGRAPSHDDPMFHCRMTAASTVSGIDAGQVGGRFAVTFGFHGLKIHGTCDAHLVAKPADKPEWVDILVDGQVLRRENLGNLNGGLGFYYTIRRPALELFPSRCVIEVRDSLGRTFDTRAPSQSARSKVTALGLSIPFGSGELSRHLAATGPLDKKGWPRPSSVELARRQAGMLALYARVRRVFERSLDRPLFLLYGTLLGQHRSGDFIPGDDDFDVGYVSRLQTPAEIKAEAIHIMQALVAEGLIVVLNTQGRPFRVRDAESGVGIHLDCHIVFTTGDGHVWCHPQAHLPLALAGFESVEHSEMRGAPVLKPVDSEGFLRTHYGPGWRTPDPNYATTHTSDMGGVTRGLRALCLTRRDQRRLERQIVQKGLPGAFIPMALEPLYPLDRYIKRVGFFG